MGRYVKKHLRCNGTEYDIEAAVCVCSTKKSIKPNTTVKTNNVLKNSLRRKEVKLKKVNSKYILKSTLTPRLARKEFQKEVTASSPQLSKSRSCTSLEQETSSDPAGPTFNNYLTVHSFPSAANIPTITTQSYDELVPNKNKRGGPPQPPPSRPASDGSDDEVKHHNWTTMTPQEIAFWIDKRARILFPLAFVFFNIIYWTFVYCL